MNRKIAFNAPLSESDAENQIYGCKANNPNIGANDVITNICAFLSVDDIYRKLSRAWRKKYTKLLMGGVNI